MTHNKRNLALCILVWFLPVFSSFGYMTVTVTFVNDTASTMAAYVAWIPHTGGTMENSSVTAGNSHTFAPYTENGSSPSGTYAIQLWDGTTIYGPGQPYNRPVLSGILASGNVNYTFYMSGMVNSTNCLEQIANALSNDSGMTMICNLIGADGRQYASVSLLPYQDYNYTATLPCAAFPTAWYTYYVATNVVITQNGSNGVQTTTTQVSTNAGGTFNGSNGSSNGVSIVTSDQVPPNSIYNAGVSSTNGNSPVIFGPTALTNGSIATEQGSAAIVAAIQTEQGVLHNDLTGYGSGTTGLLGGILQNLGTNRFGFVANTNGSGETNYALETTAETGTNLLGLINSNSAGTYGVESNLYAWATNTFSTNGIANPKDTNWIAGVQSTANSTATALNADFGTLEVAGEMPGVIPGGSGDALTIAMPGGHNFIMGSSVMPSLGAAVLARLAISALIWLRTYQKMVNVAARHVLGVLGQTQLGGNQQMALGNNADLPTGLSYVAIVAAALVAVPVALAPALLTTHVNFSGLSGAVGAVAGLPMWSTCTQFVPVDTIFSAITTYFGFRYLLVFPAVSLSRIICKFCIR